MEISELRQVIFLTGEQEVLTGDFFDRRTGGQAFLDKRTGEQKDLLSYCSPV